MYYSKSDYYLKKDFFIYGITLLLGIGITEYILVSRGAIMGLVPITLLFVYITNKSKLNINENYTFKFP